MLERKQVFRAVQLEWRPRPKIKTLELFIQARKMCRIRRNKKDTEKVIINYKKLLTNKQGCGNI